MNSNNNDEKTLNAIKRIQNGDSDAFAYLYDTYYEKAKYAAEKICTDSYLIEDYIQEAFTKCYEYLVSGNEIENFGAYITKTTKNIAIDAIRKREADKRPKEVFSTIQQNEDNDETLELIDRERNDVQKTLSSEFYESVEETLEKQEVKEILQEILDELPDVQQETLQLYYLEGYKIREIADIHNVSVDTANSRLKQGREKVKKKVLELEKTKGIKLHSLAPISFFFLLFKENIIAEAATCTVSGSEFMATLSAEAVKSATKVTVSKVITKKSIKDVAQSISASISKKVLVAGVVGTVGVGTVIGVTVANNNSYDADWDTQISDYAGRWVAENVPESDWIEITDYNHNKETAKVKLGGELTCTFNEHGYGYWEAEVVDEDGSFSYKERYNETTLQSHICRVLDTSIGVNNSAEIQLSGSDYTFTAHLGNDKIITDDGIVFKRVKNYDLNQYEQYVGTWYSTDFSSDWRDAGSLGDIKFEERFVSPTVLVIDKDGTGRIFPHIEDLGIDDDGEKYYSTRNRYELDLGKVSMLDQSFKCCDLNLNEGEYILSLGFSYYCVVHMENNEIVGYLIGYDGNRYEFHFSAIDENNLDEDIKSSIARDAYPFYNEAIDDQYQFFAILGREQPLTVW